MTLERSAPVYYPESDGKPVAETDIHRAEAAAFINALEEHFRDDSQVYVAGNNFIYYQKGNRQAVCSPDVYTVHGVTKKQRRSYKLWEEAHAPSFVMELSSHATWMEDTDAKKVLYARLGVKEYFLYDPQAKVIQPPLKGYRLNPGSGRYRRILTNPGGRIISEVLGLTLWLDDAFHLHFADAASGEELWRYGDQIALRRQAERRHQQAERRCRTQALRADDEAVRADKEAVRANEETVRADKEASRADEAAKRADEAERELARLRGVDSAT